MWKWLYVVTWKQEDVGMWKEMITCSYINAMCSNVKWKGYM
jgi:hypothetical protein